MPGDWDKSVHPDLVDEAPAEQPAETPPERPSRRRSSETGGASDTPLPPVDEATSDGPPPEASDAAESEPETPDWFAAVREAKDPTEALRSILKNVPYDELEKDDVFSGLIGNVAERRVKAWQAKQDRDAADKAKLEAAANNDLYTLGELTQRELQQQLASQQAAQAAGPFMDGVVLFQKQLPESIQKDIFREGIRCWQEPRRRSGRIHRLRLRAASQARASKARVCTSQVSDVGSQRRRACPRARLRYPRSRPRSDRREDRRNVTRRIRGAVR